jgi:hypothetical protein
MNITWKKYINQEEKIGDIYIGVGYLWRIYVSLVLGSKTFMVKKKLSIISLNPFISDKTLDTILDDKFGIIPYLIWMRRARTKAKGFTEGNHKKSFKILPRYM